MLTPTTLTPEEMVLGWRTRAAGFLRRSPSMLFLRLGARKRAHCPDRETGAKLQFQKSRYLWQQDR